MAKTELPPILQNLSQLRAITLRASTVANFYFIDETPIVYMDSREKGIEHWMVLDEPDLACYQYLMFPVWDLRTYLSKISKSYAHMIIDGDIYRWEDLKRNYTVQIPIMRPAEKNPEASAKETALPGMYSRMFVNPVLTEEVWRVITTNDYTCISQSQVDTLLGKKGISIHIPGASSIYMHQPILGTVKKSARIRVWPLRRVNAVPMNKRYCRNYAVVEQEEPGWRFYTLICYLGLD